MGSASIASASVNLKDDSLLEIQALEAPLPTGMRQASTELLRSEWAQGDLRWEEGLAGDYADSLRLIACMGRREGEWVGNATTAFAVRQPELGVICDVATRREQRGLGIAGMLMQTAIDQFHRYSNGPLYLGAHRGGAAERVYRRLGFDWFHGGVMRRLPDAAPGFDQIHFAPDQSSTVRPVEWGDLPGVSALLTRPYELVAGDLVHGMLSPRYANQERCVSIFPTIRYDVLARNGVCLSLVGEAPHRILGLASLTPLDRASRRHVGMLEIMTHEAYYEQGSGLLRATLGAGRERGIERAVVYVPVTDQPKVRWLDALSARRVGLLPTHVKLTHKQVDAEIYEIAIGN